MIPKDFYNLKIGQILYDEFGKEYKIDLLHQSELECDPMVGFVNRQENIIWDKECDRFSDCWHNIEFIGDKKYIHWYCVSNKTSTGLYMVYVDITNNPKPKIKEYYTHLKTEVIL